MNEPNHSDTGRVPGPKRIKGPRACTSCRKLKTRCEFLDGDASQGFKCHRCTVLNVVCYFSENGAALAPGESSSGRTPILGTGEHFNVLHILPTPETPWKFTEDPRGHDWTAAPVLAMQSLARNVDTNTGDVLRDVNNETMLNSILRQEEIRWLLEM